MIVCSGYGSIATPSENTGQSTNGYANCEASCPNGYASPSNTNAGIKLNAINQFLNGDHSLYTPIYNFGGNK